MAWIGGVQILSHAVPEVCSAGLLGAPQSGEADGFAESLVPIRTPALRTLPLIEREFPLDCAIIGED